MNTEIMKTKRIIIPFIVMLLILISNLLKAEVTAYKPEGVDTSKDFRVWVNNKEIFVGQAGNRQHGFYSFSTFDFTGGVSIKVKAIRAIKWLDIMPSALGIDYKSIDDYTFEFTLKNPKMITIMLNNDRYNALHLLTSTPETDIPDPADKNVLYYKTGKIYEIGVLDLKDNQTLYIEGGAVLKGMVRIRNANNVKVCGRGMIDGHDNNSSLNAPTSDDKWRLLYLEHSKNIKIEGITFFDSHRWTIHPYACNGLELNNIRVVNWNFGSDGTDISACQNVKILNSFYRTNDDPIVIKALSFKPDCYYPNPPVKNPDVKDILVEGCTVWNMPYGNAFEIGFELRCDRVGDIIFRNCDVLMQEARGAVFSIHNSDNALVENVLFEDMRLENINHNGSHKLFDIAILFSMWSYDKFEDNDSIMKYRYNDAWDNLLPVLPGKEKFHAQYRGQVRNIKFRNIQILDGALPYSVVNGFDEDHLVENVTFENITVQGKKLKNEKELKLFTKFAKNVNIK